MAGRGSDRLPERPAAGPSATGTYQIGFGVTDPAGTLRTVAYTTVTDTMVEGSYDLQFRSGTVQGGFSAPMCLLCAPRPTSRICLER